MKFQALVFLPILCLTFAYGKGLVDFRVGSYSLQSRTVAPLSDKPNCTQPGLACGGCKHIYVCDSQNKSSLVWNCPEGETCNKGQCTTSPTIGCSQQGQKTFICTQEGVFPDPGNCFMYHICIATQENPEEIKFDYARECNGQYSYNARTTYCDKKSTSNVCLSYPVPLCLKPAQTGALLENPSMYYICAIYDQGKTTAAPASTATTEAITTPTVPTDDPLNMKILGSNSARADSAVLYPYLYLCPNGRLYDGKYGCRPK